ncbi:gliding motility-associated C-terminal domain-containing protein [Lutibacter aestuarii]|uniref:Gliding motility-associated C-terminal domain-containing protein n=1 Tax=Lutibacter aestuarii TaxID=861111 RepID=A0ABW2Z8D2_9FLAO
MKKEEISISYKTVLLFIFILLCSNLNSNAQCTNDIPSGEPIQTFCKNDNNTIESLIVSGTLIAWYDAPSGGNEYKLTDLLIDDTIYYADDISNGGCSTSRLAISVEVYGDIPKDVDVFVGKCASNNPTVADLSATGTNIEWFDAQTGGNLLPNDELLIDGKTYWVQQTENGCVSDRFPTTVTIINPPPPTTEPFQSFCAPPDPTVSNLQAAGTNIIWYDSETSITPLSPDELLINGEDYWAAEISFPCESSIRSQTIVTIDSVPNSGESNSYIVCEIDLETTNLFELLGGNPETTGTWSGPSELSNGYLGTFEPNINTIGTYIYTVSSTLGVCPSNSASITVNITETPPPTTNSTTQTFCEINNPIIANLNAEGSNILWFDSETSSTPLNQNEPIINGKDYWASQTNASGCQSNSRLKVSANIISVPLPTTTETNQNFCKNDNPTITNLIANGTNLLWYDTETSSTPLNENEPIINGEDYWATQTDTNGCQSASRLKIIAHLIEVETPTTSQTTQTFCEVDHPTIENLSIHETNILWYASETSSTPLNEEELLVDGANYWAAQTNSNGCQSSSRLKITASIISTPPPTSTVINQSFCVQNYLPNKPTIANLNANGTNLTWYDTETSLTPLNENELLVDGEDYWASQTNNSCESNSRLLVNVTIINPIVPTTSDTTQLFCTVNNPTVANLEADGESIVWFETENSTTALNPTELLIDGEDYWAASVNDATGCESTSRLIVTVKMVETAPPVIENTVQTFCKSDNPTITDLQVEGNNVVWYISEHDTTPLSATTELLDGVSYWAAQVNSSTNCESSVRIVTTASLINVETPTITPSGNKFCKINNPTLFELNLNVSTANDGEIIWYNSYPNGSILSMSEILMEGKTYYAVEKNESGCTSPTPLAVTVTLNACEAYDIEIYDGFSPDGDGNNDTFHIKYLRELYPNFKVEFFNRWGAKVYTSNASKVDWNGRLYGTDELVPTGVYYFIIYFNESAKKPIQGRLYISR